MLREIGNSFVAAQGTRHLSLCVPQAENVGDDVVSIAGLKNQVRHVRMRTLEPNRKCHPRHASSVGDLFECGNGWWWGNQLSCLHGMTTRALALRVSKAASRVS